MKRFVAAVMMASALMVSVGATSVRAVERYSDENQYEDAFSNPLRLAYYVIHPIGFGLEWLVMRPFQYVVSRPYLDKIFGYTPVGEEGTYNRMGEHM